MMTCQRIQLIFSVWVAFLLLFTSQNALALNKKLEINGAIYTNFVGSLMMVGAEFPVLKKLAVYARVGTYGYSYSDFGDYTERGNGNYIGAGVGIYPMKSMEKLRIGVGLEQISGKADWEDGNEDDKVEISGTSPAVTVGWKFLIDGEYVIEPNILYVNIPSGDLKNSVVVGFGVLAGMRF